MHRLLIISLCVFCGCNTPAAEPTADTTAPAAAPAATPAAAPASTGFLINSVHWKAETARAKERDIFASTDPGAWMNCMAARTNRMLQLGACENAETLVPVSLQTDLEFFKQHPAPEDVGINEAIEWETAYRRALQLCAAQLQHRGLTDLATQVTAQEQTIR